MLRITLDLGKVIAAIITAIVTLSIAFVIDTNIFRPKYVSYKNSNYGIELEYPENWSKQEENDFLNHGII